MCRLFISYSELSVHLLHQLKFHSYAIFKAQRVKEFILLLWWMFITKWSKLNSLGSFHLVDPWWYSCLEMGEKKDRYLFEVLAKHFINLFKLDIKTITILSRIKKKKMVGAFHWTRNFRTFKGGINRTEISCEQSQEMNFANMLLNHKFWEHNQ